MHRSSRNIARIDYKTLHETGDKVDICEISELFEELSFKDQEDQVMDTLLLDIETLFDDINDFIEENPVVPNVLTLQEIDDQVNKLETLRSLYRRKHKELQKACENYEVTHGSQFKSMMISIKDYIQKGNDVKHKFRMKDFVMIQENQHKEKNQIKFLLDEINRVLLEIEVETKIELDNTSDDQITHQRKDIINTKNKINLVSKKITMLLSYNIASEEISESMDRYTNANNLFNLYEYELRKEVERREIDKEVKFNESKLNIKLGKFKGYDSLIDIYTFQDDFEKLYNRSTPKRLMPDLLKNNHLDDPALSLVKSNDDITEIWNRLVSAYGNPKIMLNKRLQQLDKFEAIWKIKDTEKSIDSLTKITNLMKDLLKMCEKHEIESYLFNGNAIEKIYRTLGDVRVTRWLSKTIDDDLKDENLWLKLIQFIERDVKIQQQKLALCGNINVEQKRDSKRFDQVGKVHHLESNSDHSTNNLECSICGEIDHVATTGPRGMKVIQYFTCKKFVTMTPHQRFTELRKKGLCFQCLLPGASTFDGRHKEGKCQRDFTCQHPMHEKYPKKKHILVCEDHKDSEENRNLLQKYKDRCILRQRSVALPEYSKDIQLSFFYKAETQNISQMIKSNESDVIHDKGIYQLQIIKVNNQCFTIFYDSGCGDFVVRKSAIDRIGNRSVLEFDGPINIGGVGDLKMQSPHGIHTVKLPLRDGKTATMTGICLEKITATFPNYPLQGKVENDIQDAYQQQGGDLKNLPSLPDFIGGDVDFMIGIKYLRYHPEPIFQLPSGLTIYKSMFQNADGSCGVIGGPHAVFTQIENQFEIKNNHQTTFLCNQLSLYRSGYQINPDVHMLGYKTDKVHFDCTVPNSDNVHVSRQIKSYEEAEETGTVISYRCVKCRNCVACKDHDSLEEISIKEEIEQDIINKSVSIDTENRFTIASLPFIHDPVLKLAPNKHKALRVFNQQVKKLNKSPQDKLDVIKSESKLQALGHVDYLSNLSNHQQLMLQNSKIQNYIPWRAVWKDNSLSTPCRLVFDASQPTDTGYSLNNLLAKGRNNMNKLQEIILRWFIHKVAYHTDVQKMYNSVQLREVDWCFQRYIWEDNLDPSKIPQEKVIKTLIYGVKSSGNQAEQGLRETATLSQKQYPEIVNVVHKDVYVDDCMSGEDTVELAKLRADQLEIVLNRGGFTLKGISFSGEDPPHNLSDDHVSISVGGMKWFTKDDELSLDIGELCFSKKSRGRRIVNDETKKIPLKLTRRHCLSKVSEVFDLTGKVTPIICAMKLDLHELIHRKIDWDDCIPEDLHSTWLLNFETLQQLKTIRFKRAIVPIDATSLDIDTIDFGDASKYMACSAIYARFKRQNGEYSSQLVMGRSKIIPEGMSQPRAELVAALLNTHSGEVVSRAFGAYHKSHLKLSDSQIVLFWIQNDEKPLKQWVRNRIIEIRRLTNSNNWYHVDTTNMIADIGTRKVATLKDIGPSSTWINGYDWMKIEIKDMPIKSMTEIKLTSNDVVEVRKESPSATGLTVHHSKVMLNRDEITQRYQYSKYLVDPNKHRFEMVVRIMSLVLKFIKCLKQPKHQVHPYVSKDVTIPLSENEIRDGRWLFFQESYC